MAYHISSACISCGACESECPVSAISEADGQYQINPDLCIDWRRLRGHLPCRRSGPGLIGPETQKGAAVFDQVVCSGPLFLSWG